MLTLTEIKQLEYELPAEIMRVHLHKPRNIKGMNTDIIEYKCDINVFYEKLNKYNSYKLREV